MLRAILGFAIAALSLGACTSSPCSSHRVVQATIEDSQDNRKMAALGPGLPQWYAVELDDGHVYRAGYPLSPPPPMTGESVKLCDVQSQVDNSHKYSITIDRTPADDSSKIHGAELIR